MPRLRKTILTLILSVCCSVALAQPCDFTINRPSGCVPLGGVNFTDITAGVVSRNWDLGNGTLINNGGITVGTNYLTAGTFNVKLTVFYSTGDSCTATKQVVVHPKPIASFISNDTAGCASHNAAFTDLSTSATGTVTNWQWDFGSGGSSMQNPVYTYTAPGSYQVSLVVTNNWGCVSDALTIPDFIQVYPRPQPSFTTTNNHTCGNSLTVQFTNTTSGSGPITYLWNFGDGNTSTQTNPTHTYTGSGIYTVTLTAQIGSGCSASVSTTTFTNIQVGTPQAAILTAPDTLCANQPGTFSGTAIPAALAASVRWVFTDDHTQVTGNNATHSFSIPGLHDVLFIATSLYGCADTAVKQVYIKPGINVDFTADKPKGCRIPWTVQFSSSVAPAGQYAYAWNFGDGNTSTQINPSHTYATQGLFTVTLTVTDTSVANGCSTLIQKTNYIEIRVPSVNFNLIPQAGCRPLPVNTTAVVSNIAEPVTQYQWNFGDGFTQTSASPNGFHVYNQTGVFHVQLTITTQQGCVIASPVRTVTVIDTCTDDGSGGGNGGAGFIVGKSCTNKYQVTFTDTTSNTVVVKWDFGDGNIAVVPPLNPIVHQYNPPQKVYYVTVVRSQATTGLLDTGTKRVVIIDEHANFVPSILNICQNINVTFTTLGIDSSLINHYYWNFGDGTPVQHINNQAYYNATGNYLNGNTSHTYTDTGVFNVQLIIEDRLGCRDTFTYPLPVVVRGPSANFGGTPLTSCVLPFDVTFTDSSLQNGATPIIEWSWSFGDGSPLYTTNVDTPVSHTYVNNSYVNFYPVTLTIRDAAGCVTSLSKPAFIKAYQPHADFFSSDTLMCGVYNVQLFNSSQAYNAGYTWYYGDGTSSISFNGSHTYTSDGLYDIKLVVRDENGCMDSITKPAYIKLIKPVADFSISDTTQCAPAIIRFRDSSQYARSWQWDFGDGGTGSTQQFPSPHIYAAPGFYTIKLKITSVNGCVDSISKTIRVRGPIAQMATTSGTFGCKPFTVTMKVTGQFISTYAWDFNDGTPVTPSTTDSVVIHTYPNAGMYIPNVVLTSPEGCPYTLRSRDTIFVDSARADFTYDVNACATVPVQFNNTSSIPFFSSITKYKWNFGDGGTDSVANPQHAYASAGTYDVSLRIWTRYGCTDSIIKLGAIVVHPLPQATIIGDTLFCRAGTYSYASSIVSVDPVTQYEWLVNNNVVATNTPSLTHHFYAGSNRLQLKVTTNTGCFYIAERHVNIDSVKAGFAPNIPLICGNEGQVQFFNSTYSLFGIQSYYWTFGDGTFNAIDSHPPHAYIAYGDYTVTLIATSIYGCKDTLVIPNAVRVHPPPSARIVGDSIRCMPGIHTYFSQISSADPVPIIRWFIDTTLVSTDANLTYNFSAGVYRLKMYAKTVNGCTDTTYRTIIIDSLKAGFSAQPSRVCAEFASVAFNDTSGGHYNLVANHWNFGDGQQGSGQNPLHAYANPGEYDVELIVTSEHGCHDTLFVPKAVRIYRPPKASITGDSIRCRPGVYTYNGVITSTDAIAQRQWWVNGTPVSNNTNLSYAFAAGNYTIRFAIATVNGCTDTVTRQIIIDSVRSSFTVDRPRICDNSGTVQFTNTSGSHFGINIYNWNFGDGGFDVTASPSHFYAAPGHYNVQLIAGSIHGCSDTLTVNEAVIIYARPQVAITSETEKCRDKSIHFEAAVISEDSITAYEWKLNNTVVSTTQAFDHLFTADGNYTITLNVKTRYGCDVTVSKNIVIHPLPVPAAAPDTLICNGRPVQLHSFDGVQYAWSPAVGLSSSNIPNPVATPQQTTSYTVKVTNTFGCEQTDTVVVRVDQPVNLQTGPDQVICERGTVQLSASGNAGSFKWTPATALNDANIPNPLASPTQTTIYQVVGYSTTVCPNDTASVEVIVEPDPKVYIGPDVVADAGKLVTLNPTLQGNITQYNWTPATGLSCAHCAVTQFGADKNITYQLRVNTQHGCTATDEVNIVVNCNKGAVYIPSAFTPNNDGVNDRFYIQGFGLSIVKSFRVFNRWGKLVFVRNNFVPNSADMGWDGTVEGKRVNETTTFVYQVEVVCASTNLPFGLKGTVTLIR